MMRVSIRGRGPRMNHQRGTEFRSDRTSPGPPPIPTVRLPVLSDLSLLHVEMPEATPVWQKNELEMFMRWILVSYCLHNFSLH